jgi:hypothetical protein
LAEQCQFELWKKNDSRYDVYMLCVYAEDEILTELCDIEFDLIIQDLMPEYDIVYFKFDQLEYMCPDFYDDRMPYLSKQELNNYRNTFENLYKQT